MYHQALRRMIPETIKQIEPRGESSQHGLLSRETLGKVQSIPSGTNFSGNQEGVGVRQRRY